MGSGTADRWERLNKCHRTKAWVKCVELTQMERLGLEEEIQLPVGCRIGWHGLLLEEKSSDQVVQNKQVKSYS